MWVNEVLERADTTEFRHRGELQVHDLYHERRSVCSETGKPNNLFTASGSRSSSVQGAALSPSTAGRSGAERYVVRR